MHIYSTFCIQNSQVNTHTHTQMPEIKEERNENLCERPCLCTFKFIAKMVKIRIFFFLLLRCDRKHKLEKFARKKMNISKQGDVKNREKDFEWER